MLFVASLVTNSTTSSANDLTILTQDWPPLYFLSHGKADGMAIEVVKAVQVRLGQPTLIQVVPWARGYHQVLTQPNVLMICVVRTEERQSQLTLVGPIVRTEANVFIRKGDATRLLAMGDKLFDQPIGVLRDGIQAEMVKKKRFRVLEQAATSGVLANMLMKKRFDMWAEASLSAPAVLSSAGYSPADVEKFMTLETSDLYLAFSPGTSHDTIKAWEDALRQVKRSGQFSEIYKRWFPHQPIPLEVIRAGGAR
ncbi:amino acid ABC transporter substrate-binding protein [Undibacterium terreum]|uniref:Amino acid ABC transporter substrate-binding protein n=1 Tax=Undibacterium terreum TaxID=1224302 RepID=A0A916V2A6_9BURK|nr:amino acid ABC transporter substrate-binding protein [Undibacterium terreum]